MIYNIRQDRPELYKALVNKTVLEGNSAILVKKEDLVNAPAFC